MRTSKTVNGVTTTYALNGINVVKETDGETTIWYYYDPSGSPVSFELNGTAYFYVKNLQGDIVAITDASGNKVVEYVYDSWGKLVSITGSLADTVGVKNPYRYRGYRYDTETGLYYLNSRYYDPGVKRFVNADHLIHSGDYVLGCNMYAYCLNNPIRYVDILGGRVNDFSLLTYNGEIHHAVQGYLCLHYGWVPEINCTAGRIDLVDKDANKCYEVKPVSYNNAIRYQSAVDQLNRYIEGDYKVGDANVNGSFYYPARGGIVYVRYWSKGKGIILYTFVPVKSLPENVEVFVPKPLAEYKKEPHKTISLHAVNVPSEVYATSINIVTVSAVIATGCLLAYGCSLMIRQNYYGARTA